MAANFDGDLIRPLGHVTLYFAYAESELDQLLRALSELEPGVRARPHLAVGTKLGRVRKLLRMLDLDAATESHALLEEGRRLFRERNELVHGCLYAGGRLVSIDPSVPERRVSQEQLTQLAESVWNWKERLRVHKERSLLPALKGRGGSAGT